MRKKKKRRRIEDNDWYELETLDTPENVQICLNCTLPKCKMESVKCERGRYRED